LSFFDFDMLNRPLAQKRIGSYPYLSVLINISLALTITGILVLLWLYAQAFSTKTQENIEVELYLRRDISPKERLSIQQTLAQKDFIARDAQGKARLRFVSKEEAAQLLTQEVGKDFVQIIGQNPLPDVFYINLKQEYYQKSRFEPVRAELEAIEGVMEVGYKERYVLEIQRNLRIVSLIFVCFAVAYFIAAIVLINNAIRLALFSQRFLIRSMQLVGATADFIKKPFLIRAFWQGLGSAFIATLLVVLLMQVVFVWIADLEVLHQSYYYFCVLLVLLVVGISVNVLSAYWVCGKYLKMSLDDLY
jgi:cell division transport system permease protein